MTASATPYTAPPTPYSSKPSEGDDHGDGRADADRPRIDDGPHGGSLDHLQDDEHTDDHEPGPVLQAERQQHGRDPADEDADQRDRRQRADGEAEGDRRRQADPPAHQADDDTVDDGVGDDDQEVPAAAQRSLTPDAPHSRLAGFRQLLDEPVEVPATVGQQEQHEDAGDDVGGKRRRRCRERVPADPVVHLVDELLDALGEVDVGEHVVLPFEVGGGGGRTLRQLLERVDEVAGQPGCDSADDREQPDQHDDHGQPPRHHPLHQVDDRVDQQGDDRTGDDPTDRAMGGDEGVAGDERGDHGADEEERR